MFRELLARHAGDIRKISAEKQSQLERHFELLLKWNAKLNLSAVRTEAEIVERHFAESLFLAARLPDGGYSIADLGSGAGFPGIPVAIYRPECAVTLIESHQRKAVFLKEAARGLRNVEVAAKRADQVIGEFDWMVSRAVSSEDIGEFAAEQCALLAGEQVRLTNFKFQAPIKLPWGDQRFLWIGKNVSRETFQRPVVG